MDAENKTKAMEKKQKQYKKNLKEFQEQVD